MEEQLNFIHIKQMGLIKVYFTTESILILHCTLLCSLMHVVVGAVYRVVALATSEFGSGPSLINVMGLHIYAVVDV